MELMVCAVSMVYMYIQGSPQDFIKALGSSHITGFVVCFNNLGTGR